MRSLQFSSEEQALAALEQNLAAEGYHIVRNPGSNSLPAFLHNYQPDAIATGKHPSLIIEVIGSRVSSDGADLRIRQLNELLRGQTDWQLRVVNVPSRTAYPQMASAGQIEKALEQVRGLNLFSPRAALPSAWALLEAIARIVVVESASKPLTPATTVEFLTSLGYLSQDEGSRLRELAKVRNLVVHGDLSIDVSQRQMDDFIGVLAKLVASLPLSRSIPA